MKKIMVFVVSMLFVLNVASLFSGCGSSVAYDPDNFIADTTSERIVKEDVTITMFHPKSSIQPSWDDMALWEYLQERTGIKIEFREADSSAYSDLRSLQWVNQGSWPDLFYTNNTIDEQTQYSALGALTALNDDDGEYGNLLEQYAPNFMKMMETYDEIEKASTLSDGNIYSFTSINTAPRDLTYKMYVNNDWMQAYYDKDQPETIEEFTEMLRAFKSVSTTNGGVIPLTGTDGGLSYVKNYLLSAFGYTTHGIQLEHGTSNVTYAATTDNYKAFLEYANSLYKEGLLYNDTYSATATEIKAFGNQGRLGVFQGAAAYLFVGTDIDDQYSSLQPLTSSYSEVVNGEAQKIHYKLNGFLPQFAMIPSTSPYSREIVRLMDWFYTEEASTRATFGEENVNWQYTDDTETWWETIIPEGTVNTETYRATLSPTAGLGAGAIGYRSYGSIEYETDDINKQVNEDVSIYEPYLTSFAYNLQFTTEETARKAIIETDISSHMTTYEMKFITGDKNLTTDWDEHITRLESYGVEELIEIYQAAYDRYISV